MASCCSNIGGRERVPLIRCQPQKSKSGLECQDKKTTGKRKCQDSRVKCFVLIGETLPVAEAIARGVRTKWSRKYNNDYFRRPGELGTM